MDPGDQTPTSSDATADPFVKRQASVELNDVKAESQMDDALEDWKDTIPSTVASLGNGHGESSATAAQRKKKPGPKRDSRPAPSEKLERNRQAQRTHRERKEQYTKELEREVMRLKDLYVEVVQERDLVVAERAQALAERDAAIDEVRYLREVIQASGLSTADSALATRGNSFAAPLAPAGSVIAGPMREQGVEHTTSPGSLRESAFGSPGSPLHNALHSPRTLQGPKSPYQMDSLQTAMATAIPSSSSHLDYDELGLDFVLTLERPCMQHQHYLAVRAHNPDAQNSENGAEARRPHDVPNDGKNLDISGHALMATAPTLDDIMDHSSDEHSHQMPDLKRPDLVRLLNISHQLPCVADEELPPVRAWLRILQEERLNQLTRQDFDALKTELLAKVQCLRFGAIISEADILEAIAKVFESKQLTNSKAAITNGSFTSKMA